MATLDAYMFDYEPYRGGSNPKHTGDSKNLNYLKIGFFDDKPYIKKTFCDRILSWLKEAVKSLGSDPVVIAIAPGHEKNHNPTGFMHDIVGELLVDEDDITDGRCQLIRTKTVPKQSQTPGARSEDIHRGTIEINGKVDNSDKVVVILDDIWTSGSTLTVCEEVMNATNPKKVKFFVIGKTVPAAYN